MEGGGGVGLSTFERECAAVSDWRITKNESLYTLRNNMCALQKQVCTHKDTISLSLHLLGCKFAPTYLCTPQSANLHL